MPAAFIDNPNQPDFRALLRHTLPTELLNFWGSKIDPLWSLDQALAKIVGRQVTAEGSISLILKANASCLRSELNTPACAADATEREGIADRHVHPSEPRSVRLSVRLSF